jgi:hypothetical protein
LLYRTVQDHWSTFLADLEAGGGQLPAFVLDEVEAFLRCGIPFHGFLRVRCKDLCRYLARPPIANDRLQELPDGRLALRFKQAWRDGDGRGEAAWGRGRAGRP